MMCQLFLPFFTTEGWRLFNFLVSLSPFLAFLAWRRPLFDFFPRTKCRRHEWGKHENMTNPQNHIYVHFYFLSNKRQRLIFFLIKDKFSSVYQFHISVLRFLAAIGWKVKKKNCHRIKSLKKYFYRMKKFVLRREFLKNKINLFQKNC